MYDGARSVILLVCLARGGVWVMRLLLFLSFLLLLILAALGVAFDGIEKGAVMHGLGVSIYGGEGCMR